MKSLEARFEAVQKKRPGGSSLTNYGAAIKGCHFSYDVNRRWFNKLVDKDDYSGVPKSEIMRHLDELTNPLRTSRIGGQTAPGEVKIKDNVSLSLLGLRAPELVAIS